MPTLAQVIHVHSGHHINFETIKNSYRRKMFRMFRQDLIIIYRPAHTRDNTCDTGKYRKDKSGK